MAANLFGRIAVAHVICGDIISYYWLDSADNLMIGWDNAPHHATISSPPHHMHVGAQTSHQPSDERTLEDVLVVIRQQLVS